MSDQPDDLDDLGALDLELDPAPLINGGDRAPRGKPGPKPWKPPQPRRGKISPKARAILDRLRASKEPTP